MTPLTANPSGSTPIKEPLAPKLPQRIPSLDGMRAVAILPVVIAHMVDPEAHPHLAETLGHIGNYGVRIFFVISGFLITGLLLKEYDRTGAISLKAFYTRRVIRIFPAFYAYIGVVCLLGAFSVIRLSAGDVFSAITYTMNYREERSWYVNHIWSLSVEEQFYLLWPALFLFAKPPKAMRCAAIVLLLAPLIRAIMYFGFHGSPSALSRHFETISDALASGCLLAGYYNRLGQSAFYRKLQSLPCYAAFPAILILLSAVSYKVHAALYYIVGQSLANIGILLLLDYVVRHPHTVTGAILNVKPVMVVGLWSYSIYLWQELLLDYFPTIFNTPLPAKVIAVFLVSALSYYGIEKPFLKLRRYVPSG